MPSPRLSLDKAEEAVRAVEDAARDGYQIGGIPSAQEEAARRLNMNPSKFRTRLRAAQNHYNLVPGQPDAPDEEVDLLDLPPSGEVLERASKYSRRHIASFYREKSMTVKVKEPVFAAWFMGDPHLDSPGCDIAQARADLELIGAAQQEQTILAVNIGDTLDHWPTGGRLAKKLADGHLTAKEALSLARWLARDTVDWTAWLIGNHDAWAGLKFSELVRDWGGFRVADWGLFLHVESPGREWVIPVSHDFAGHSMHNPLHALMRRAREDGSGDLYVAGHRHTGAQGKVEDGHRKQTYNLMRVRGYKRADEYAFQKGYAEQAEGCSGLAVFNSNAKMQDGEIRTFYDLEEGLDWMRFLRART